MRQNLSIACLCLLAGVCLYLVAQREEEHHRSDLVRSAASVQAENRFIPDLDRAMLRRFDAMQKSEFRPNKHTRWLVEQASGLPRTQAQRAIFHRLGPLNDAAIVLIGDRKVCLVHLSVGGAACENPASVLMRGIALGTFRVGKGANHQPTGFAVIGVAPNHKSYAVLALGSKRKRRAIRRNIYVATASVPIQVLGLQP